MVVEDMTPYKVLGPPDPVDYLPLATRSSSRLQTLSITQQLARLQDGLIDQCTSDVRRLDDLYSFRLLETDDYLDLDWSPAILEGAARLVRISSERLTILELATAGGYELNPAYRDFPGSIWQHAVAVNPIEQVSAVHTTLQALSDEGFPTPAAAARAAVAQLGTGISSMDAPSYLRKHSPALNDLRERGSPGAPRGDVVGLRTLCEPCSRSSQRPGVTERRAVHAGR